jgi:hypothetical protein
MKKIFLLTSLLIIISTANSLSQIKVNSSGYVGINNTSPTYRLDLNGNMRMVNSSYTLQFTGASFYPSSGMDLGTSGYYWYRGYVTTIFLTNQPVITSDTRFKTNITPLTKMKDKVLLLNPVSYNLRTDVKEISVDKNVSTLQFGFIAQEFQDVFPDMVSSREDGIQGIRYTELIPVLVQTIKEQQTEIDALTKRVSDLESKIK